MTNVAHSRIFTTKQRNIYNGKITSKAHSFFKRWSQTKVDTQDTLAKEEIGCGGGIGWLTNSCFWHWEPLYSRVLAVHISEKHEIFTFAFLALEGRHIKIVALLTYEEQIEIILIMGENYKTHREAAIIFNNRDPNKNSNHWTVTKIVIKFKSNGSIYK